ncbi:hypothetical protein FEJ81_02280 [Natrinema versiforme]|uniref:Uncharacterized protein n=1 Tax=Natrinema versiforme TaxID=88724 RepID=A0A4V1FY81_9EURY|nr:hypothetical protein FEJ81_02280 [Natrinema versiforme]
MDVIVKGSENPSIRIEVHDETGVREFENLDNLFSNPFLPDNILKFALSVRTDHGHAKLRGNGKWDTNKLYLKGNDEWVSGRKDEIEIFIRRNELSKIRSHINFWPRLGIMFLGLGFLVSTQIRHILYLFGVPIYYTYTVYDAMNLVIGLSIVSAGWSIHKLWPYVAIKTEDSQAGYAKNLWRAIVGISIILGIVGPLIQIVELI